VDLLLADFQLQAWRDLTGSLALMSSTRRSESPQGSGLQATSYQQLR
jgi:hypothetical protein